MLSKKLFNHDLVLFRRDSLVLQQPHNLLRVRVQIVLLQCFLQLPVLVIVRRQQTFDRARFELGEPCRDLVLSAYEQTSAWLEIQGRWQV